MWVVAFALASSLWMAAGSVPDNGDKVPTLSFLASNGQTITLDEAGMLYLVSFWSPECAPCMDEMPDMEKVAAELEPTRRFKFVTVLWAGPDQRLTPKATKKLGQNLPVYMDRKNWREQLGVANVPTKFLIRDSRIIVRSHGSSERPYEHWKWLAGRELDEAPTEAKEASKEP
jgi:thiol-disulfide isomerase/thioredoxin